MDTLSTAVGAAIGSGISEVTKQGMKFLAAALGHPEQDLGTILGNQWNARWQQGQSVLGRAGFILLNLGIEPDRVAPNVLHPAIEAASLAEEEELKNLWANMLANAADPRKCNPVLAVFPGMLKVLSPREVKLVDYLSNHRTIRRGLSDVEIEEAYKQAGLALSPSPEPRPTYSQKPILNEQDTNNLQVSIDILMGARILFLSKNVLTMFSPLGWAFLKACQPPEK